MKSIAEHLETIDIGVSKAEQAQIMNRALTDLLEAAEYVLQSNPTGKEGLYDTINQPELWKLNKAVKRVREIWGPHEVGR